jgi:hypothetical protein
MKRNGVEVPSNFLIVTKLDKGSENFSADMSSLKLTVKPQTSLLKSMTDKPNVLCV